MLILCDKPPLSAPVALSWHRLVRWSLLHAVNQHHLFVQEDTGQLLPLVLSWRKHSAGCERSVSCREDNNSGLGRAPGEPDRSLGSCAEACLAIASWKGQRCEGDFHFFLPQWPPFQRLDLAFTMARAFRIPFSVASFRSRGSKLGFPGFPES